MVSRRIRARFFNRAAPPGFFPLTPKKRKALPFRYVLLLLLTLGGLYGWSFEGGRLMASLNPALRMELHLLTPAIDAWITPPEYTGMAPIMIATPAGSRYAGKVIDVPEGSTLTAHMAEDGDAPELLVNGEKTPFIADADGDFQVMQPVQSGDVISIRRGWQEMASWRIHVIAVQPPHIALTEPLSITDHKALRLSYEAKDAYGIASVVAHITPRASNPGLSAQPVDIALASPDAKNMHRVSFEDVTAYPWAGQPVQIELIATNVAGQMTKTSPATFTVPERTFNNPVAQALIEERTKLEKNPDNEGIRNEVANVMAGIAHVPLAYRGDTVVLMALRSGAVRLVLSHSNAVVNGSVDDLLWEAAVRIEDGTFGIAERHLREAQKDLADALDRKAGTPEVQGFVDRLREALASYLAALSMRAIHPVATGDLSQNSGLHTNRLGPKDMDMMLRNIKDFSASGAPDAARDELRKLEQQLETLRNGDLSFSDEMHHRNDMQTEGTHNAVQRLMQNF